MKLKEALQNYEGQDVKVGAGTGYFYCSCAEGAEKEIKKINKRLKKTYLRRYNRAKNNIKIIDRIWAEKYNKAINLLHKQRAEGKTDKTDVQMLEELNKRKQKDVELTKYRIEKYQDKSGRHTNLMNREVKEIYDSILGDGVIIIIDGDEVGKYWTKEEYESGKLGSAKRNAY